MKYFFTLVVFFYILLLLPRNVAASPIVSTTVNDTYTVSENSKVRVERAITIKNKFDDQYVESFTLSFSSQQLPQNIQVMEDKVDASYTSRRENGHLLLKVQFKKPAIGLNEQKTLTVSYDAQGLLNNQGGYKELVIPVDPNAHDYDTYVVEVVAPNDFPSLGLSKPRVTELEPHVYRWTDVQTIDEQGFYISFGDQVYYSVELHYALKNDTNEPHRYEIPFIPDGAFQKTYLTTIDPKPEQVRIDEDDNILGTYTVSSHSVTNIVLKADVELSTVIRPQVQKYLRNKYRITGMSRYLTQENYWSLPYSLGSFSSSKDIYTYVVSTLSYDTGRINNNLQRMGAVWILENPNSAVCMEYTDLFIAIARESGIGAREVVGYGVTGGDELLPVSFFGDILHAWPEYFDTAREIWHPVDPTWGDTSGVDYYSSLDLNHIAFVYHGTSDLYPLPPGVYKLKHNTKDVYVASTDSTPGETGELKVSVKSQKFTSGKKNNVNITVESGANTILYDTTISLTDERNTTKTDVQIPLVAPYQTKQLTLSFNAPTTAIWHKGTLHITVNGKVTTVLYTTYPWYIDLVLSRWYLLVGVFVLVVLVVLGTRKGKR